MCVCVCVCVYVVLHIIVVELSLLIVQQPAINSFVRIRYSI